MNKEKLNKMLNSGLVLVEFTKKDNTVRKMICTTSLNLIPENFLPKNSDNIKTEYNSQKRVFDTQANGWRSFLFENVINFEQYKSNAS
jgi:hypothetical protein